ncbi:MAG: hypothetical protein CL735_01980 [Chloroflexi bacterium]|nr:hypothetical protein [Chloroflexota bacterium]|tara:strand:- start:3798 stop:5246 length:1449 start_codon:yes stop_codon:yes gene_type:complete
MVDQEDKMEFSDRQLAAHLARRAGFGATPDELDRYVEIGYEDLVEQFLDTSDANYIPDDLIFRRHVDIHTMQGHNAAYWGYRMVSTDKPFQEKIALFWHQIFATGENKLNNLGSLNNQVDMFRRHGLGRYDDLLIELSKDPAMIFWLDNHDNHNGSINENYGREILELFSMGVGNYTEEDIKECSRAFTGWTVKNGEYLSLMAFKDSIWPYGRILWHHEYREEDHDDGEKQFLGESGRFNGEDVVEIICRQDATANFIARHIYNFFVADEVPVPQWGETPPRDPEAVAFLADAYKLYDHDIKSVMRVLFNSDFFKGAVFQRVKSPVELIIGTLRATGEYLVPVPGDVGMFDALEEGKFMGQTLLDPPSVEGWHTGKEWINSGALVERVNFASSRVGDGSKPGVKSLINRILNILGEDFSCIELIDASIEVLGTAQIDRSTRDTLIKEMEEEGNFNLDDQTETENRITNLLTFLVSTPEFQLA